jgi:diadenosine tetraphosphate (Ap4A) HIT family hydrolase
MSRHRIEAKYQWSILKEYEYWTLLLYDTPTPFLGRAVIWLAREGDMQRFSSLFPPELAELQQILTEYERALDALLQPDHLNYMWLGNLFHEHGGHGHLHVLPRYKEPREFDGVRFIDANYGKFPTPYKKPVFSRAQLEKVCEMLRKELA